MAVERERAGSPTPGGDPPPGHRGADPGAGGPDTLLKGFYLRVRRLLVEVEGAIRQPELQEELRDLSGPSSLRAEKSLLEMKLGLEAAMTGAAELRRAMEGEASLPPLLAYLDRPLPTGLPESVRRFLRERSRQPGFEYRLENDAARGWTLVWKQRDAEGEVVGAGHLFERPFSPSGR